MKTFYLLICATLLAFQVYAQSNFLLNINGEGLNPIDDLTGYHTVDSVGTVVTGSGEIIMPTGSDYLKIDPFLPNFDINGPWTVSFDAYVTNNLDSIYFLDWRSNSNTGHMHIAYKFYKGIYFSDRALNGIEGSLVADSILIPDSTWVHIKVTHLNNHLTIFRDDVITAEADFSGVLSPTSTTTIGYSEDFRYPRDEVQFDNVKVSGSLVLSVSEINSSLSELFPNPAENSLTINNINSLSILKIYDLTGKSVLIVNNPHESTLDVSSLYPGMYFIKSIDNSGKNSLLKFLKK